MRLDLYIIARLGARAIKYEFYLPFYYLFASIFIAIGTEESQKCEIKVRSW